MAIQLNFTESLPSQVPPRERRNWRISRALVVLPLFGYVLLGLRYLGFVRDDWNHYVNMRDLHERESLWDALWLIATNEWFGAHELRVFFGSFLTHFIVSETGSLASPVIYAIQLAMHVASAALVGYLIFRFTGSQLGAISAALILTFAPTTSQASLWINNLFFVQPWFFLCLTAGIMSLRSLRWTAVCAMATVTALICQFSGEATIPVLYGLLVIFAIEGLRRRTSFVERLAACTPALACAASLFFYLGFIVTRPAESHFVLPSWEGINAYAEGFRNQFQSLTDVASPQYGAGSVHISAVAVAIGVVFSLSAAGAILMAQAASSRHVLPFILFAVALVVALVLSLVPMLVGMATGSRPGPDLRYQYVPSQLLYALVVIVLVGLGAAIARIGLVAMKIVLGALTTYVIFLTVFNVVDIWGLQRKVDQQIWSRVDPLLSSSTREIVTYNPNHQYLMAPYLSNAVSDFQADWGVAGRIAWEHPEWARVGVYRDAELLPTGDLALRGYYGDTVACREAFDQGQDDPSTSIFMTYDYGQTFGELPNADLLVTLDASEFETSRSVLEARAPEKMLWPQSSIQNACPQR